MKNDPFEFYFYFYLQMGENVVTLNILLPKNIAIHFK